MVYVTYCALTHVTPKLGTGDLPAPSRGNTPLHGPTHLWALQTLCEMELSISKPLQAVKLCNYTFSSFRRPCEGLTPGCTRQDR
jgi:hypothetical protein